MLLRIKVIILVMVIGLIVNFVECKRKRKLNDQQKMRQDLQSRETDTPNFIRLLVMRLIYGIAVQIGAEDRLAGFLNGIFVPPNADDEEGFGGIGDLFGDIGGGDDFLDF